MQARDDLSIPLYTWDDFLYVGCNLCNQGMTFQTPLDNKNKFR